MTTQNCHRGKNLSENIIVKLSAVSRYLNVDRMSSFCQDRNAYGYF